MQGGLLCLWKPAVFQIKDCCGSGNFILLSGSVYHRLDCVIGNVYAPNDSRDRSHLWLVLANLKAFFPKPWCLEGDFNEIKNIGERKGYVRCDRGMLEFNEFSNNLELADVPTCGRKYTWSNLQLGVCWSRIDRFLLNLECLEWFSFKLWGLLDLCLTIA